MHDEIGNTATCDTNSPAAPSQTPSVKSACFIIIVYIYTENMKPKRKHCEVCQGCKSNDCGACKYCKDKPKYSGPGKLKQSCIQLRCLQMN